MTRKIRIRERSLRDYYGYAYPDKNLVELRKGMRPRTYLNTLIHEILHILYPDQSETKTLEFANTLTKYIWEKGYRRLK